MMKDVEAKLEFKVDAVISDFKETGVQVKRLEALQDVWEQRSADAKLKMAEGQCELSDKIRDKTSHMDAKLDELDRIVKHLPDKVQ